MGAVKTRAVTLSAEQIVGGCTSKPRRQYREAALERAVYDFFIGAGQFVRTQVYCGFAGRADVVTEDAIYELKDWLTRRTYYQAIGQLQGYRYYLNPDARGVIICNGTNLTPRKLRKFEAIYGVSVLVGNPPYPMPRRP